MNKRIDLTWFERFPQHDEEDCAIITDDTYALNWEVPKLIAELKRCYDLIDKYEFLYGSSFEEHFWIATCKPDAEGQCSLDIESYEELMELVAADKVEIPEYSHDNNELILHDGCTCGVSHEEWLESKN
jgi:hypothetical protein